MKRTVVIDVVGLTPRLVGRDTPFLAKLASRGGARPLRPAFPAVTCTAQANMLTGTTPREHGIVANGWYFRDLAEVWLWRQSNRLVGAEKVWEEARRRDPTFRCAKMFWWYNMYSSADVSVTPRPIYCADGLKLPDIYSEPADVRDELTRRLGEFPLFEFWGPRAGIRASEWIARAAQHVFDTRKPTLSLVYLPHLDYDLQRFGPDDPRIRASLRAIDGVCAELIEHVERAGAHVLVLSEYGITSVSRPVHVNRILREAGLLRVREELGTEKLDAGASDAFAVADHQIAHVYVRDEKRISEVRSLLENVPGIDRVLGEEEKRAEHLDHPRAGELVAVAAHDAWFTYYFWLDDARAPDYARTVDIHRKPGYDPVELFVDPELRAPALRVALRLAQKKLGMRYLLDVIPLDASLVRGSHGRAPSDPRDGAVVFSSDPTLLPAGDLASTDVRSIILRHVFPRSAVLRASDAAHEAL
jgi:predicted AlkP superfamily pyrophosphatase or phosphodiesterase